MKNIEKYVSQYVANQFPSFYKEEGETFIAFIKAYYEWLESSAVSTLYLEVPTGAYAIGETVVQPANVNNTATVTEVGPAFIKVIGSGTSFTPGPVYKLDSINSSPSGKVTCTAGSSIITGDGTSFLLELDAGDFIVADGSASEIEYVASNDVAKIPFKSGVNYFLSSYVIYRVSQKSTVTRTESSPNVVRAARELPSYADIDTTLDLFIDHFVKKYLYGVPRDTLGDKRNLIKNIINFYRAKGTDDAFKFLFRLLYNESVEIYVPGKDVLRASESEWVIPRYLEVSDSPYLKDMVGKQIYNSSKTATALVENFIRKIIKNKPVNVLSVSQVNGNFNYSEYVLCDGVTNDLLLSPKIIGSLSSLTVDNGGYDFKVGDVVDVQGSGLGAKARVTSIMNLTGKVRFSIRDGGSGYSVGDSVVTVSPVYNLLCNNSVSSVVVGERVYQTTGSNTFVGEVLSVATGANTVTVKRVSGTPNNALTLTTVTSALSLDLTSFYGGGTGASFAVGGIKDPEIIQYSTETLAAFVSENIDDGDFEVTVDVVNAGTFEVGETITGDILAKDLIINYAIVSSAFQVGEQVTTGIASGIVDKVDGDTMTIKGFNSTAIFFEGDTLTGVDSGATATITKTLKTQRVSAEATIVSIDGNKLTTDIPFCYTVLEGYYIPEVTIDSAGQDYAVGDVVEFIGGSYVDTPATAYVESVDGSGAITGIRLVSQGRYSSATLPDVGVQSNIGTGVSLSVTFERVAGDYLTEMYLTGGTSGAVGYVTSVKRLYDWTDFVHKNVEDLYNLDAKIEDTLNIRSRTVGTIDYLKNVNPGTGYNVNPHVEVLETNVSDLYIYDAARDNYKGRNAKIDGIAGGLTGIIGTVEVIDSGFGYGPQERVLLTSDSNPSAASATSVIFQKGRSPGYWKDDTSFLSSNKYIIDSYYYQEYSYDLRSKVMIDRYKEVLLKLAHPAGSIPFGSFLFKDSSLNAESTVASSYLTQAEDA